MVNAVADTSAASYLVLPLLKFPAVVAVRRRQRLVLARASRHNSSQPMTLRQYRFGHPTGPRAAGR
jgi:hypothetical protein